MSISAAVSRACAPLLAICLIGAVHAARAPDARPSRSMPSPVASGVFASVLADGRSSATKTSAVINAAVGNQAAGWLMLQQFPNGSFPWGKGDVAPAANTQGATALGLLRTYDKNHDPALLDAARRNGDCQLAGETCITGSTYGGAGGGHHRFSGHDPLFLHRLSIATGNAAYDDFVDAEFWGRLATGTYGASANLDLAGYIANDVSARSGFPELVAWDLAKLAIAAHETGRTAEAATLMAAIKSSLEQGGPGSGHTSFDEIALAGAIWASAETGIDLDPATGGWSAANSTVDLANTLAALQMSGAPNAGAFSDTSTGIAGGNSDGPNTQATAYAMLALGAVNPIAYASNISNGFAYIRAQQQGDGQILYRVGSLPTEAGGVESHAEALESYALNQFQPDRWVGLSGTDTGDCSNAAARCRTIAYAIGQSARYDTIHVAAGTYAVAAPLNVALEGLKIVGDDPLDKPVVTRTATFTDANQPLLAIANVKNVRIANLDFHVDLSYAAEGIQAFGIVDGLLVEANRFTASQSTGTAASFGRRNAVSINLVNRQDGSFARVRDNVIDGQSAGAPPSILFRAGVAMDAGVGEITGNTIVAQSHDVIVRFATTNMNSSGSGVLVQNNQLQFGGISFTGPNASPGAVTINGNTISAPAYADQFGDAGDFALGRIIANGSNIALTISNNQFSGHAKFFRGLLIENFPGVTLSGNTFTPKAGATDFASLVLSNKELASDNPPAAPRPLGLIAKGNTFNGSGVAGAGTAVMFIDDNDSNGAATYGSLMFGGAAGEANTFDGNLRWYYYLRDETCSTTTATIGATAGGPPPQCTFLGYNAVGALPNTFVRPFAGNVSAAQNSYAGAPPSAATISAIQARTWDDNDAAALGIVLYGVTPSTVGTVDFAPTAFTYDGFSHAIAASLEEDATATCMVVPATVTNAGDTNVSAHCTSFGYDVVSNATVHVAKAIGTARLAQTSFTYNGAAQALAPSMLEEPGATCLASPTSVTTAGNYPVAVDCSGVNHDAHATIQVIVAKATGSIELAPSHFDYTNTNQAVHARIAQEPATACIALSPTSVHNVGSYQIHVDACAGTNYDAPAAILTATVGGSTAVHVVETNLYYATVADALADAATLAGMTIELAPGTYPPLTLTKSVHLVGSASFTPMFAGTTTPPGTIIDGGGGAAYGIVVANGVTNASIGGFEIRNVTQHCIAANQGNDGLSITQNVIHGCGSRGISVSGIAASGITGVTIDHNEIYATGDRGIVVWDGIKRDITITSNWVHDLTGCCGIELQDGAATGAVVTDNVIENTGDSGMAFIQLTSGSPTLRANQVARNTISNTGRFGIEIKIPNGSGAASGDGAIVVEDNIVTSPGASNLRDRAGIAVIRRSLSAAYPFELDRTTGVIVRNNQVSGFRTTNTAQYEGYGIVVEGLGSSVSGNLLSGNDVGLQVQQGNPNGAPPGDADQNFSGSDWFGRGNAPFTCVSVDANTIGASTLDDQREVPAGASMIGSRVLNQNTGARYCSINSAVAAATAGDTLVADAGTYAENVVIDKPVTLRGAKAGDNAGVGGSRDPSSGESIIVPATIEPGLTLSSSGQAVVGIEANDVTVDGFVIDGDNAALTSPVTLNGSNPDASTGMSVAGNRMHLQNLVFRNLVFAGIDGYATSTPSGDNHFVDNRFTNITTPSLWGIGILLQDNFYAEVAGNLMGEVRIGVQTNNNSAAAPGGFAPSIAGNEIHATRNAIFHNLFYSTASPYSITGNTLVAAANPAQAGGWKGLWLESMGSAQTVTIVGNTIDGSALFGTGRTTAGYVLNNVTSSAPAAAIDGGSVSHVDIGVLSTDATGYTGPVNDFIVRNVAFDDIAIAALYVEDTQQQTGSAKLTVGNGNTYTTGVAHTLALSGAAPAIGHGGGAIASVLVRSARTFFNGTPSNGPCTPVACTVVSSLVNDGVAAVDVGGMVDLEAGIYAQNAVLGKRLTLRGPHHGEAGYAPGRGVGESVIAPPSGIGILLSAADVVVDGVSIEGVATHAVQRQAGDPADNLRFANNRIVGVNNGSGIFSEPGATGAGDGFLIERNLFSNINGSGAQNGRGIVLFKGTRNAQVLDNRFEGIQQYALQANGGSGTFEQLSVTGNVAVAMLPVVSATSFVITGANAVTFERNTVGGTGGGLFISDRTTNFEASCNVLAATGSAISTSDFFANSPNANVRIFDNALSGGSFDLSSQMAQGLIVGSNWYDGAAPGINGASVGLFVADPLLADPTNGGAFDVAACGDNTPVSIVAYAGSPQSTPVTTAFSPLHARVEDLLGGAVMGQSIALTAPAPTGPSASLGTPSGTSNYNGELISSATANGHAGSYLVGADSGSLHADFALTNAKGTGTVVFDNTSLTYSGSAQALLAHVVEDPTAACTLTPPSVTNAGSYPVSANCSGDDYTASGSTTVIVAKAIGTVTFDALTYTGSAQAATAHITEEPGTSCTVTPAAVGPNAGSYPVSATCSGTNFDASGNGVVVIGKATSTVTINAADLHQSYGSTHAVGANASPISTGHVDVTYDGSAAVPTAVGNYSVLANLVDPNYEAAPASAVLTIGDAADITITVTSSQAMALVGSGAPYTDFVDYTGTLRNAGAPTGQAVHTVISVVRIDDGNTIGENPIAIDAADVQACILDPSGWAAQEPGNHNGCPQDYESLVFSQGSGAYNGRPAVTFRYPVNPIYDQPLPTIDPAVATPPTKFLFKRGDYQVHVSLVGADGMVYASAFDGTTVPEASVSYAGATSGQAEDALLSTTRLRNTGGRVDGNVVVRVTLSDAASSPGTPVPLVAGDVEFAYQLGETYFTLPWAGSAGDGGLVTYFGPGSGFPLEDGYDATTAGRGIFHREGSYRLTYEVLDAATQAVRFASSTTAPITIGPNLVNFALSDLAQVYDGTPRAVTVTPNGVPHTTVYEPLAGASCPASPSGANTTPPTNAGTYCVYVNATGTYQGGAQGTLVVAKANAVVALDDDDGTVDGTIHRTFNAAAQVVGASSTPTVASIVVTYDGSPTAPGTAGTYGVVATVVDANYSGHATGTLIVAANGGATIVLDAGALSATWDGNPHAVTATTTPGGIAYAVSYVGDGATVYPLSPTPPSAAGAYHVVATTTDANYAPVTASGTLIIVSAGASIALDAPTLSVTWDGNPHAVTATTTPTGLAYIVTYDGHVDPPSAVGSYAIVATLADANHNAAPATGTLVISAAGAAITLDTATLAATYDGQTHAVTATTSPTGLAYAVTYNGSATPPVNAGSYAIVATVTAPGHSGSANGTLVIAKATGVVSFSATNATFDGSGHSIGAVISQEPANGVACSLTPAGEYPRVNAGSTSMSADCSGTNYVANGSTTLVVSPKPVTIGLSGLGSFPYDGATHAATATVAGTVAGFPAGTVVTYAPGGAGAPVAVGTYGVVAILDALSTNYAAPGANGTIIIGAANASVTLANLAQVYDGTPRVASASTTPGSLAVSVTYDGSATPPTNAGSYTVVATITEPGYSGNASGTLVVSKASATVALSALSATYDGNPHAASASTTPDGLALSLTYDGSATAPTNAGSYAVVATITDPNHAGNASGTLTIAKAAATVSLSDLTQAYDGTPRPATVTTTPNVATSVTYDGTATAPTEVGTYSVVATVTDPNYTGSANGTLHIVNGDANAIAANGATTFTGTAGQPLTGTLPSVKVTDAGGHPVAGIAVTFAAGSGDGTLSGATQTTDQNGVATLGGWTLDATAGTDTVVATAAGVSGDVTFTATSTADAGGLALTITDGRMATQIGRSLTYTITVGNPTSSAFNNVVVTDGLPIEFDAAHAHWQCVPVNGATCTASGDENLVDSVDLPPGSSVVYLLSATVVSDLDGVIDNQVVAVYGVPVAHATDRTEIVIFRDGFDGGDGAEPLGHEAVLGQLASGGTLALPVVPAAFGSLERKLLARALDGRFRVEAIGIDGSVHARLVVAEHGVEQGSAWARVIDTQVVLGVAAGHVTLSGTDASLALAFTAGGSVAVVGASD